MASPSKSSGPAGYSVRVPFAPGASGWPSPKMVHWLMLNILERLGNFRPLEKPDVRDMVGCFIYPNVVHWALHMRYGADAVPFESGCPHRSPPVDCKGDDAEFKTARRVSLHDGSDVCAVRSSKHPWALQVTLLWNSAGRQVKRQGRREPCQECAWEAYKQALPAPAGGPLSALTIQATRSRTHKSRWENWAAKTEGGIQVSWTQSDEPKFTASMLATLRRDTLEPVVAAAYDDLRTALAKLACTDPRRVYFTVRALAGPMKDHWRLKAPFPKQRYQREINDFLDLLDDLEGLGLPQLTPADCDFACDLLCVDAPEIGLPVNKLLRDFVAEHVLKCCYGKLPPGQFFNELAFQDLFWDWVGDGDRADSGKPFDLRKWVNKRWGALPGALDQPRWRRPEP